VACGKGRHAIQLSNKGFDVTGIDLSEMSIEEALKEETDTLHFYQHDMRQPFWINYFDYAFNFFTSFGYFKTERENHNAIQTIAQSLKKGGILVIDYLNVRYTESQIQHQNKETIDNVDFTITRWYDDHKFYKKILIEDPTQPSHISYTEMVSKFTLNDFAEMMQPYGITIKEVFGNYQMGDYDENESPRMIIVAKKS
jgi:SAM-dependent methyltransferase